MSVVSLLLATALAEAPRIALLTIEPGEDFVSKAGHATLCVDTPDPKDKGVCYNYGSTNTADELALTLDYLRGTATFWVSTPSYASVLKSHGRKYDRTIWRQDLELSEEDAWNLTAALKHDALPENRYYQYDHFYDNCTSRLRDAIDRATNGALSRGSDQPWNMSWRLVARDRLAGLPWFLVGVELTGRPADKIPTLWDAMVLPEVLRAEVERRLHAPARKIHERQGYALGVGSGHSGAAAILAAGALVAVAVRALAAIGPRSASAGRWLGSVLLGLMGLVCLVMVAVSNLAEVRLNEVLVVFFWPDIAIAALTDAWRERYVAVRIGGLAAVLLLAGVGVFTQPTWVALATLLVLLALYPATLPQGMPVPGARSR